MTDASPSRCEGISLTLLAMAAAGVVGSFSVRAANAWMNSPTGFRLVDGEVTDVDPLAAMFNDAVWLQWTVVISSRTGGS